LFAEGEVSAMDKHAEECEMDYNDMLEVFDPEPREDATADKILNFENVEAIIQEEVNHPLDQIDRTNIEGG
jgi:hypothetical protein